MGFKKHVGRLCGFFESGSEGVWWMLWEDSKSRRGNFGLVSIDAGDRLKVFNPDGSAAFERTIEPDYKAGQGPGDRQPHALGFDVHWTQRGWEPDSWARMFVCGKEKETVDQDFMGLRAELVKKFEEVNRVVFSRRLYLVNGFSYVFHRPTRRDANHIPYKGPHVPKRVVAAKIGARTLVVNIYMTLQIKNGEAILACSEQLGDERRPLEIKLDKSLIARAYKDERLVYSAD